ncbi:MAG: hypothetical protein U1F43_11870 [Myxococcota bacterium]
MQALAASARSDVGVLGGLVDHADPAIASQAIDALVGLARRAARARASSDHRAPRRMARRRAATERHRRARPARHHRRRAGAGAVPRGPHDVATRSAAREAIAAIHARAGDVAAGQLALTEADARGAVAIVEDDA